MPLVGRSRSIGRDADALRSRFIHQQRRGLAWECSIRSSPSWAATRSQVKQGIDKAADVIDDKAGEHADKVQQGAEMAKDAIDKLPDA